MRASARELLVPFLTPLVWRDRGANPRSTAPEADALTTKLLGPAEQISVGIFFIFSAKNIILQSLKVAAYCIGMFAQCVIIPHILPVHAQNVKLFEYNI